jgi:homoisocitrate dehydrogenase
MIQYVKQENLIIGEHGKEARATRLITERASRRIGQMAFEIAQARPRKVSTLTYNNDPTVTDAVDHSISLSSTSQMYCQ